MFHRDILTVCLLALIFGSGLYAQDNDKLRLQLESGDLPDSTYVASTLQLAKQCAGSKDEFLIGIFGPTAIEKSIAIKDTTSWAELLISLGNQSWHAGDYPLATDKFQELRLLANTSHQQHWLLEAIKGLGNVYYLLGQNEEALDLYREGLYLSREDSGMLVRFYHNIANVYVVLEQYDSVVNFYQKSVKYHQAHENYRDLSISYGNIALVYSDLHNKDSTQLYFNLAEKYAYLSEDPYQVASIYAQIGSTINEIHPEMAIDFYLRSNKWAAQSKSSSQILDNLEAIADSYANLDDPVNEAKYRGEAYRVLDSMNVATNKAYLMQEELEFRGQIDSNAKHRIRQKEELEKVKIENRQKMIIILLTIALFSFLIIFFFGAQTYRLKARINRTKDRFFSLIAHDLRSPLNGVSGLISVLREEAEEIKDDALHKKVLAIEKSIGKVQELTENLLDWAQTETGRIAFNPKTQDLRPLSENVIQLFSTLAKQQKVDLVNEIPSNLFACFDKRMIHSIIRNLVSNALKFTKMGDSITLRSEVTDQKIHISVSDTGSGISPERMKLLFSKNHKKRDSLNTSENGSGLGLIICRDFIKLHHGEIWADSEPGKGSTFHFNLPLNCNKSSNS